MTLCTGLPYLEGASMGELLQYSIQTINTYGLCAAKLNALQEWIIKNN